MEAFQAEIVRSLSLDRDVTLETVLFLHKQLFFLKTQLNGVEKEFFSDLCAFLSKHFTVWVGQQKVPWEEYIDGAALPAGIKVPYPENLLEASMKLDFLYDPRREHDALNGLLSAADALATRSEVLRDQATNTSGDETLLELRSNESACGTVITIAKMLATQATAYEHFANKLCVRDLSMADRDVLFCRVSIHP